MPGIAWTRERLLEYAGFKHDHVRQAVTRTVEALDAVTPVKSFVKDGAEFHSGGEPDHALRLQAADRIFDLADVRKPRTESSDATRPVNVSILIGDRAAGQISASPQGYTLSFQPQQVVDITPGEHKVAGDDGEGQGQLPGIVA